MNSCFYFTQHLHLHVENKHMGNFLYDFGSMADDLYSLLSYNNIPLTVVRLKSILNALSFSVDRCHILSHSGLRIFGCFSHHSLKHAQPHSCICNLILWPCLFSQSKTCCLTQTGWLYFQPEGTGSLYSKITHSINRVCWDLCPQINAFLSPDPS